MSNVHGLAGEHPIHGRSLFNADFDGDAMNTFAFMIDERYGRVVKYRSMYVFPVRTKFPRCGTAYHQGRGFVDNVFVWDIYTHVKSFLEHTDGIAMSAAFNKSFPDVRFDPVTHPKSYLLWRTRQIPWTITITMSPNVLAKHPLAVTAYVLDDRVVIGFTHKYCFCNRCVIRYAAIKL